MSQDALVIAYENLLHDIKTPMALLYACLQQAEESLNMRLSAADYIQEAQKKWFMIIKLLNDTSDHVKINKGLLVPHYKNYDIPYLVKSIVEGTRTLADRKNIDISFNSSISHKLMAVDKVFVERAILNLLSNAIKFTGNNGIVRVLLRNENGHIVVTIQDNGPGIPDELMNIITERYVHEDNSNNKYGHGIGLSIVKDLVELLGGRLHLESSSSGTSAEIHLPVFITDHSVEEMYIDDFYSSKIVQIELSEHFI